MSKARRFVIGVLLSLAFAGLGGIAAVVGVYVHDPDFAARYSGTGGIIGVVAFIIGALIGAAGAALGYVIVSGKSKGKAKPGLENDDGV